YSEEGYQMSVTGQFCSLTEFSEKYPDHQPDVLIIGSGPAGVAVAERLYARCPRAKVTVLERGGVLLGTHIHNLWPPHLYPDARQKFINKNKQCPYEGSLSEAGMLIPALGGRGIVAGAHLRRFDQ